MTTTTAAPQQDTVRQSGQGETGGKSNIFFALVTLLALAFVSGLVPADARAATWDAVQAISKLDGGSLSKTIAKAGDKAKSQAQRNGLVNPVTKAGYRYAAMDSSWVAELPSGCAHRARPYVGMMNNAAKQADIDVRLLGSQTCHESGFSPTVCSGAGACGLEQLMPATAQGLGVTNRSDPQQSLNGGARYLRGKLDRFGKLSLALAAYNAGPNAVLGYENGVKVRGVGVPPYSETIGYVARIQNTYRATGGTP